MNTPTALEKHRENSAETMRRKIRGKLRRDIISLIQVALSGTCIPKGVNGSYFTATSTYTIIASEASLHAAAMKKHDISWESFNLPYDTEDSLLDLLVFVWKIRATEEYRFEKDILSKNTKNSILEDNDYVLFETEQQGEHAEFFNKAISFIQKETAKNDIRKKITKQENIVLEKETESVEPLYSNEKFFDRFIKIMRPVAP